MISCIEGTVKFQSDQNVYIMTSNGVGYRVYYSLKKFSEGQSVFIYTYQVFRENSQELFGFDSMMDLQFFEILNKVKGVGPKSAYSLISSIGTAQIAQAIEMENKKVLSSAPGIGMKAASQIILDLSGKLGNLFPQIWNNSQNMETDIVKTAEVVTSSFLEDTIMACKDLGFPESVVRTYASKVLSEKQISSSEELLTEVLRGM